jgi:hypothetical protein
MKIEQKIGWHDAIIRLSRLQVVKNTVGGNHFLIFHHPNIAIFGKSLEHTIYHCVFVTQKNRNSATFFNQIHYSVPPIVI